MPSVKDNTILENEFSSFLVNLKLTKNNEYKHEMAMNDSSCRQGKKVTFKKYVIHF